MVTCRGPAHARRGRELGDVEVLKQAAVLLDGERIGAVGPYRELRAAHAGAVVEEVRGVLFPGFVDCHTHAVFAAPRLDDHERRARGEDYQTIAALGGGILESVRDVRALPEAELLGLTRSRIHALRAHGSTTIEVKSGYGLDPATELKQLRVIRELAATERISLVPTFLGAHAVPPEFQGGRSGGRADYIRLLCDELIPQVARERLAVACDVFCEPGVFAVTEARAILTAAQRHGLGVKLHADELEGSGGAELAAELGALSADHLAGISETGVRALARADTVAVLLPATMAFLGTGRQAPARRLVEAGAAVALATDFNPGSSPTVSLPLVMALGVSQLGFGHAEVLTAVTVNAAAALGLAGDRGQIAPGLRADLVSCAVSDWREVAYWMGANLVTAVWTGGFACPAPPAPISLGLHVEA